MYRCPVYQSSILTFVECSALLTSFSLSPSLSPPPSLFSPSLLLPPSPLSPLPLSSPPPSSFLPPLSLLSLSLLPLPPPPLPSLSSPSLFSPSLLLPPLPSFLRCWPGTSWTTIYSWQWVVLVPPVKTSLRRWCGWRKWTSVPSSSTSCRPPVSTQHVHVYTVHVHWPSPIVKMFCFALLHVHVHECGGFGPATQTASVYTTAQLTEHSSREQSAVGYSVPT